VFPKEQYFSVGMIGLGKKTTGIYKTFEQYRQILGINRPEYLKKRRGAVIPIWPGQDAFVMKRVILTGDAAGFVDPFTAEGIFFALLSGKLAASCLIAENFDENKVRHAYELEMTKNILFELQTGRRLAGLFYDYPAISRILLRLFGRR
jgi:flavin-dependent dehydrogenase